MSLDNILESIMFALGRKISVDELSNNLEIPKEEIENSIKALQEKYSGACGINMVQIGDMYMLVTNKEYYKYVEKFVSQNKCENLTNSVIEVLSIIAYNDKITKSQIEKIRGVNSDFQVSKLLEYGLIEEVGRMDTVGKPALFSVTDAFLRDMGIKKIDELPDYEQIKKANEIQENLDEEGTNDVT